MQDGLIVDIDISQLNDHLAYVYWRRLYQF